MNPLLFAINETTMFELRPGATGFGVDSIVKHAAFGQTVRRQEFWSKNEAEARAFIMGAQMVAAF
jgi:hypothetical protein